MNLRSLAHALGGEVSGRQIIAPGPKHSPRDRSLAVRLDPAAPDGFVVHSFAGDDWQECRDYVRFRLGLPSWEPGDEQQRMVGRDHLDKWDVAAVEGESKTRTEDDIVRIQRAQNIWDQAVEPGQQAKDYLASRALDPRKELFGNVLRFHPNCPWRNENTGQTERVPCLIAAFRSTIDDIVTGIHRIRIDQPQHWPKTQRMMLGVIKYSAIKLGNSGPSLAIGEGLETCLAAMQLGIEPVWALGSVGNISFFPVLDGVGEIRILCETGEASRRAFKMCGRRWWKANRTVNRIRPTVGSDLNDSLMMGAAE
jgi:putative DNA primase/helicase